MDLKLITHAIVQLELKALIVPLHNYWAFINPIEFSRVQLSSAEEHQSDGLTTSKQGMPWWYPHSESLTRFFAESQVLRLLGRYKPWLLNQPCEFAHEGSCCGDVVMHGAYPYISPRCWHHDLDKRLPQHNWLLRFGLQMIASSRHCQQLDIDHLVGWAITNQVSDLLPAKVIAEFNQVAMPSENHQVSMPHEILNRNIKPVRLSIDPEPPAVFMARPKLKRFQNEAYLQFVRSLPCVMTGKTEGVEAHHLIGHGVSAMGTKTHDLFTFPLCHEEHMNLHQVGWQQWERYHSSQIEFVFRTLEKACELRVLEG